MIFWDHLLIEERRQLIEECARVGHDFYYIEGTRWRWDCARCNWFDVRGKPTLPLEPSKRRPRFELVQNW